MDTYNNLPVLTEGTSVTTAKGERVKVLRLGLAGFEYRDRGRKTFCRWSEMKYRFPLDYRRYTSYQERDHHGRV